MNSQVETAITAEQLPETGLFTEKTYVMKGDYLEKTLETYHLILAPSFHCNLGCKHCYLPNHNVLTLPKERVLQLVDEWSDIVISDREPFGGIFHIKGGEPLILPYLNDVLDLLAEIKTLRFMMTTNGIPGDWDVVERLDRLNTELNGEVAILISLDGSNEAVNAQLRGPGSFEKAVAFVQRLKEVGVTTYLNYVVHRGNMDDIDAFVELALDLEVAQVNFLSFVPKGHGETMLRQRPKPLEVFERIHAVWERGDEHARSLLAGCLSDILHAESCGICTSNECVGGYRGLLYIVPNGVAYSCPNLNYPGLEAGNILDLSLANVHGKIRSKVYDKINTPARELQDRYLCKGISFLPNSSDLLKAEFVEVPRVPGGYGYMEGMSYCFSRNF